MQIIWDRPSDPTVKLVYPEYYDAAAGIESPLPFPSPVNDSKWLDGAVEWFAEGQVGVEIGAGRGEFTAAVLQRNRNLKRFYIVDMSQGMLEIVKERIRGIRTDIETIFILADVEKDDLGQIPAHSVDRVVMINAFQDIAPAPALRTFHRLLSSTGQLRVNLLDREMREKHSSKGGFFDTQTGLFFIIRPPSSKAGEQLSPIGRIVTEDGEHTPFFRVMRSYYRSEIDGMFEQFRIRIVSANTILLPKKVWLGSVATDGGKRVDSFMMRMIDQLGGYPSSLEVIAEPEIRRT